LFGCAEMPWARADTDAETAAQDLDACFARARVAVGSRAPNPTYVGDPKHNIVVGLVQLMVVGSALVYMQVAADRCMYDKGYHLNTPHN
jgi:hypothetical protein